MKVIDWIAENGDALEPLVSYGLHHAGEDEWDRRLHGKRVIDLTQDEIRLLREFNATYGGDGPKFLRVCLAWIDRKDVEMELGDMSVTKLWCILSLAWNKAFVEALFERREDKNATREECIGAFIKDFFDKRGEASFRGPHMMRPCGSRSRAVPRDTARDSTPMAKARCLARRLSHSSLAQTPTMAPAQCRRFCLVTTERNETWDDRLFSRRAH